MLQNRCDILEPPLLEETPSNIIRLKMEVVFMKNVLTMVLSVVIALLIVVFTDISVGEAATLQGNFKKLANQMYEVTYDDYQTDFDMKKLVDKGYSNVTFLGGCSAAKKGQFLGRNLDFIAGDAAEIVVKTTNKNGRYATIGMFGGMLWLNSEMMDAGLKDVDVIEFIPHFIVDGMNEKGVAVEFNVVNVRDTGGSFTTHTNPGKKEVSQYFVPRYLLDRAASADEAIEILKNIDVVSPNPDIGGIKASKYELHYLICDKDKSYVVEFDNSKPEGEKMIVMEGENISTNYYLHLSDYEKGIYPDYSEGIERYRKLKDNLSSVNSVETMKKLMQSVKYTNVNRLDGEYAPGKNFDNPYTGFSDHFSAEDNPINYSNYRKHFPELMESMKRTEALLKKILKDPKLENPNHFWVTSHNTVYDLKNKTMTVAIYERFDKYYDYSL